MLLRAAPRVLPLVCAVLIVALVFSAFHLAPEKASAALDSITPYCKPSPPLPPTQSALDQQKKLLSPLLPLPEEYSVRAQDQQLCDLFYGEEYLRYIASHQDQHCTAESTSYTQTFSAPELPPQYHNQHWLGRPRQATIVRGVRVREGTDPQKPDDRRFAADCTTINATSFDPAYPAHIAHGTAHRNHGFVWENNVDLLGSGCSAAENDGSWVMLHNREHGRDENNIWHRLMEIWEMKLTLDAMRIAINPATGKPWLTKEEQAKMRVVVDQPALWDKWAGKLITGQNQKIELLKDLKPGTCIGNVVIPLEGEAAPFWIALLESEFHQPCQERLLFDTFIRQVRDVLGVPARLGGADQYNVAPTIVIVTRGGSRKLWGQDHLIELLQKKYPKAKIVAKNFGAMDLKQQAELATSADVFVSVHGAEMMHLLFLRPGAAVVELNMVPDRKWRHVSELVGLLHFETRVLDKEEYDQYVNGTALPPEYHKGDMDPGWQVREWAWFTDEQWMETVGAAVASQIHWKYTWQE